jgi:hypothetical protein
VRSRSAKTRAAQARGGRGLAAVLCAAAMSSLLVGCGSGRTFYAPQIVARGELTMRYDDGFQVWSAGQPVAFGHHYSDLPEIVRCVPKAYEHAREARSDGYIGTTLSTMGIIFGIAGLGGLGGLAYYDTNETAMTAFFAAGISSGILGVVLAGISRGYKNSANGHAVDAMNYYNDAVGSWGASCNDLTYPPPAGPEQPKSAPANEDDEDGGDGEPPPPPPPPAPPPSDGSVPIR